MLLQMLSFFGHLLIRALLFVGNLLLFVRHHMRLLVGKKFQKKIKLALNSIFLGPIAHCHYFYAVRIAQVVQVVLEGGKKSKKIEEKEKKVREEKRKYEKGIWAKILILINYLYE